MKSLVHFFVCVFVAMCSGIAGAADVSLYDVFMIGKENGMRNIRLRRFTLDCLLAGMH